MTGCKTASPTSTADENVREAQAPLPAPTQLPPPRAQTAAETRALRENSLGMKFNRVPGTRVHFSVWETRVQDYAAYAAASASVDPSWKEPVWEGTIVTPGPTHPVVNVSWFDAKAFCRWLTEKERKEGKLGADEEYRLPTDAEWSWAAGIGKREGNGTPDDKNVRLKDIYPWGRQWPPPDSVGNYDDYSEFRIVGFRDGFPRTAPVGNFAPNAQGLYDMGGNVWEWCEDWYDVAQTKRVLRGGAWINHVQDFLMSTYRDRVAPGTRYDCYGFRIVLVTAETAR